MIKINPSELTIMNDLAGREPLAIDLVYARGTHPENIFGCAIYRPDAPFVLHRRLADVVVLAAQNIRTWQNWTLVLKDGLRTVDAQQAVFATPIVKAHPEWTDDPATRMFAPPGHGGHPRGMAVDVDVIDADGAAVDMGTVFDAMPVGGPGADGVNAAHRLHSDFGTPARSVRVLANRAILNQAFADAGADAGEVVWPLTPEWWDFRLAPATYNEFAPLTEADLPNALKLQPF